MLLPQSFDVIIEPPNGSWVFPFKNGGRSQCRSNPCVVQSVEPFRAVVITPVASKTWTTTVLGGGRPTRCRIRNLQVSGPATDRLVPLAIGAVFLLSAGPLSRWQPFRLTSEALVLLAGFGFGVALAMHRQAPLPGRRP